MHPSLRERTHAFATLCLVEPSTLWFRSTLSLCAVMMNTKIHEGKRKKKEVVLTAETAGRFGMAVQSVSDADHGDKRSLCRHEWLNCFVRIAIMKYVMTGRTNDVSGAIATYGTRLLTLASATPFSCTFCSHAPHTSAPPLVLAPNTLSPPTLPRSQQALQSRHRAQARPVGSG